MSVPPMIGTFAVGPDDLDAPYWAGLAAQELRLQRCPACAAWIWGPQWRCACGCTTLGWEPVAPHGHVFSWTRTWHPVAAEVVDVVPYVVVLVAVDGTGGRRVLGVWDTERDPILGEPVTVAWPGPDEDRRNPYALVWQAAQP